MVSEPLSTAFSPFTPVAPPADVLMLSHPAPSGWHRTVGMIGVGAASAVAAARTDPAPRLAAVGPGIACGPDNPAAAFGLAVALADADVVEVAMNGPVSSEQPFLQPVAAGPTNVGEDGPKTCRAGRVGLDLLGTRAGHRRSTKDADQHHGK